MTSKIEMNEKEIYLFSPGRQIQLNSEQCIFYCSYKYECNISSSLKYKQKHIFYQKVLSKVIN